MLKSRMRIIEDAKEKGIEDKDKGKKRSQSGGEEGEHEGEHEGEGVYEEDENDASGRGIVLPQVPERQLNRSEVSGRLSMLGKTAEGDGYTYLKATLTNLGLTDLSAILSFKHIQFLDVSNNHIQSAELEAVSALPSLVLIQADQNLLISAYLPRMKYLQVIIMNSNYLTSVSDVYQPELSTLELGNNKIDKIHFDFNKMPSLRCLDFRNNLIQEITNLNFPNLDSLYLAGNQIESLVGVENLTNLRILHLRGNPLKLLTGFSEANKKLEYLNLRGCKVSTYIQVKKLTVLTSLQTLIMKGCPYMGGTGEDEAGGGEEDDAGIRIEMLVALPWLKRINKGAIAPEERVEAKELMMQWLEEGKEDEEELPEEAGGEEATNDDD